MQCSLADTVLLPLRTQAAARAWVHACERWSQSPETYRIEKAAKSYADQLKEICGAEGRGDGRFGAQYAFPTKQRPLAAGGDWTLQKSIEMRPKRPKSIMTKGKEAVRKMQNVYTALEKKFLVNDSLPSGWQESDLHHAMLYNLQLALCDKKAPSSEPAEGNGDARAAHDTEGGAGGVAGQDDENGEEKDEGDDIDRNVFARQLETDLFACNAMSPAERDTFIREHHPFWTTYVLFGPRSATPVSWLAAQPLSAMTKPSGGVSSCSRAQQKHESDARHRAAASASASEHADVMAMAVRLHSGKVTPHISASPLATYLTPPPFHCPRHTRCLHTNSSWSQPRSCTISSEMRMPKLG